MTGTLTRIYFNGRRMDIGAQGSPGYAYRVRFLGHLIDGARSAREAAR
jgi:hypothetical protein